MGLMLLELLADMGLMWFMFPPDMLPPKQLGSTSNSERVEVERSPGVKKKYHKKPPSEKRTTSEKEDDLREEDDL